MNEAPKISAIPTSNLTNKVEYPSRGRGMDAPHHHNPGRSQHSNSNSSRGSVYRGRRRCRNFNNSRPTCQVCGKFGHSAVVCFNRYNEAFMGTNPHLYQAQPKNPLSAVTASPEVVDSDIWYADSGASCHVTSDGRNMGQKANYGGKGKLVVGDGHQISISHVGSSHLPTSDCTKSLILKDVLLVPEIAKNLISVSKLVTNNDISIEFESHFFL